MRENFWPNSLKELVSLFWNKNGLIVETESNKTLLDIFAAFFRSSWLGSRHDLLFMPRICFKRPEKRPHF